MSRISTNLFHSALSRQDRPSGTVADGHPILIDVFRGRSALTNRDTIRHTIRAGGWIVRYNPVRSILEVFRDPIYYSKIPPAQHLAVAAAVALIAFVLGYWSFRRSADRIGFYV